MQSPKLVAHLIFCLDTGGLERVMANCIEQMQGQGFRHLVISLTTSTDFAKNLPADVAVYCLNKKPGSDLWVHWRLWKLLREIKPDILHSYNLATLEYHPIAWLAGISGHIHAEHGRDLSDPKGENKKYIWLRRLISPFIQQFVAVSADLANWLGAKVALPARKYQLIYNGINTKKFHPGAKRQQPFTFVHVARLSPIKDQHTLLQAFGLLQQQTDLPCQLLVVGDGPSRNQLQQQALKLNLAEPQLQFLGERHDIAELMATSQVFVLSSLAEGIPMTVLEAMSSGLAIVATAVGGLPELIDTQCGTLVPATDAQALAAAMLHYLVKPDKAAQQGIIGRDKVCQQFSEEKMVAQYLALYQTIGQKG